MIFIYLLIATVAVLIGAAIAFVSRESVSLFAVIFGFTGGAVLGVPLLLIAHLDHSSGVTNIFVMFAGFLLVSFIDRLIHQQKNHLWIADLTLVGLSIHALTDGFNLVVATKSEQLGAGLAFAILAHRVPVSTVLTLAFLQKHSLYSTLGRLMPLMVAPLIGALIGERLVSGAVGELTEYLTPFAVGTLLHVLIDTFKGSYALQPTRFGKLIGGVAFAIGLVAVFLVTHNTNFWHTH